MAVITCFGNTEKDKETIYYMYISPVKKQDG